jgi:hypothetical protein
MSDEARPVCTYEVYGTGRTPSACGRPSELGCHESAPRCFWHCACSATGFAKRDGRQIISRLFEEMPKGVMIEARGQRGSRSAADMAHGGVDLEGAQLSEAMLEKAPLPAALLARANLRRAILRAAVLVLADLHDASLISAQLQGAHLEEADLRGANLELAALDGASLHSVTMDRGTKCDSTEWGAPREEMGKHWRAAAGIFRGLSEHYREVGNRARADEFGIREARCLHLLQPRWKRWTAGALNRVLWGYGFLPWLLPLWMLAVMVAFGVAALPCVGIAGAPPNAISHGVVDGLALSAVTFATLGYGNRYPASRLGEVLAGGEAVAAMLLVSMFVVALARKYVRS